MAVVLPFEEAIWRETGVDAHYVGHPALETETLDREAARQALEGQVGGQRPGLKMSARIVRKFHPLSTFRV